MNLLYELRPVCIWVLLGIGTDLAVLAARSLTATAAAAQTQVAAHALCNGNTKTCVCVLALSLLALACPTLNHFSLIAMLLSNTLLVVNIRRNCNNEKCDANVIIFCIIYVLHDIYFFWDISRW